MSELLVPIVEIEDIQAHPNADRLDLARIAGWTVVVQKGKYVLGSKVVYVPIDSILPAELEKKLFPPESKIKLHKSRIRSIKIRGIVSQGMIIDLDDVPELELLDVGIDVADRLGITKFEPPAVDVPNNMKPMKKKAQNSSFHKYTDLTNIKWYPALFDETEHVIITEKLHGTSCRAGWAPNEVNTFGKKVLKFFRLLPKWEFCWGSRNVQIQNKLSHTGYYDIDVYTKMVNQYRLKERLPKGVGIYGEVVGFGIQAGYSYGCLPGEHKLYVFDVTRDGKYLDHDRALEVIDALNVSGAGPKIEYVPVLYVGPWKRETADSLCKGDSLIGGQKTREGVVIKPVVESDSIIGRKILKFISDDYLLIKNQTDFH